MEFLVRSGANVSATNILNKHLQPLHDAAIYDRIDVIDVLVDYGADMNQSS